MLRLTLLSMIACGSVSLVVCGSVSQTASAQDPRTACMIPLFRDSMVPGQVGRMQLDRDPRLRDYFQPVEFSGPKGLTVSLAEGEAFTEPMVGPARAALLVGPVYRLKLGGIPRREGEELFPTVEVIDRLYPPLGREHRFPIPIVFDEDDLERALNGEMVLRVVYLEDSEIAEPVSYADGIQRVQDLNGREDALQVADRMGRPMAIIRLGSRVPVNGEVTSAFLYGCPPWRPVKAIPDREKLIEEHGWPRFEYPEMAPQPTPDANADQAELTGVRRTPTNQGKKVRTARIGG